MIRRQIGLMGYIVKYIEAFYYFIIFILSVLTFGVEPGWAGINRVLFIAIDMTDNHYQKLDEVIIPYELIVLINLNFKSFGIH